MLATKKKLVLPKIKKDSHGYVKLESIKPSAADELRNTLREIAVTRARLRSPKKVAI